MTLLNIFDVMETKLIHTGLSSFSFITLLSYPVSYKAIMSRINGRTIFLFRQVVPVLLPRWSKSLTKKSYGKCIYGSLMVTIDTELKTSYFPFINRLHKRDPLSLFLSVFLFELFWESYDVAYFIYLNLSSSTTC